MRRVDHIIPPPGAFRLLLAGDVVVSHVTSLDVGRLAVMLFFFLSGYWTSRIWIEKFDGRATGRFYLSRYLRIAPLYFIVMLGAAALRHMPLHPENLSLIGLATTRRDPTGVAWSLDVELQFYILLPLVVGALIAAPAWVALIAAAALSAIGTWLKAAFGPVTVAMYMLPFILGALTYAKAWRPGPKTAALSLGAFGLACVGAAFTPFISKHLPHPFDRDLFAIAWMLPLTPFVARSLSKSSSRLDRHLGNLSYPLYLLHAPMIALGAEHLGYDPLSKSLIAAMAFAVAVALYVLVDRPLDAWRVRATETRLRLVQAAAAKGAMAPDPATHCSERVCQGGRRARG